VAYRASGLPDPESPHPRQTGPVVRVKQPHTIHAGCGAIDPELTPIASGHPLTIANSMSCMIEPAGMAIESPINS
jgi:hypothetical protein